METSSSWRMRVEKGVPKNTHQAEVPAAAVESLKSSVAGGGARKRSAGLPCLPEEDACADEDDDDD